MIAHEAAVKFYGDSLVDLQGSSDLVLLYPEILIRNTRNDTHLIKDLLIKISIRDNRITGLSANKLTYSDIEWASNEYIHSHVTGDNWGSFCLGNSDVRELITNSQEGTFTEDEWCLFFLTLENFLQTESDSPYRRIRNLNLDGVREDTSFSSASYIKKFKQTFPNYQYNITINTSKEEPFRVELNNQFFFDFAVILPDNLKGIYDAGTDTAKRFNHTKTLFNGVVTGRTVTFKGPKQKTVYSTLVKEQLPYDYPLKEVCVKLQDVLQEKINQKVNESYREASKHPVNSFNKYFRGNLEFAQISTGS